MTRKNHGFMDGFLLKLLMASLMLLDHLYYNLFPEALLWAHYAARVVAPMFAFLMTEGLIYTRSRRRYIARMLGFSFGMLAGSIALHMVFGTYDGSILDVLGGNFQGLLRETASGTILVALGLSAGLITALDKAREGGSPAVLWTVAAVGFFWLALFFEGGFMVPLMAVIFYYLRHNTALMLGVYVVVFGGIYLLLYLATHEIVSQGYMVFAAVPILLYNGHRGVNNGFSRYFFYVFYPLHIWLIYILEQTIK